ncbi:MAG: histidine ammonia-lyase [Actinobacteria bacterium]|nr:MAG: histidine ammonia-lyase [Actinomycetota bacterium]
MPVVLGEPLSIDEVAAAARGEPVEVSAAARKRMDASRRVVEETIAAGATVYGVTTGLGSLANVRLEMDELRALNRNLLRTHAVGVGAPLSEWEVRAMLVLRAHCLALGYSGVRAAVVDRLVDFLNRDVLPLVPEQGSLGASGDLAPLAHLALPLIGEGMVSFEGDRMPGGEALKRAGLEPLELEPKEGLALVNGTQGMLAVGVLAARRGRALAKAADAAAAMTVEAILATDRPFDQRLHRLRPHPGQSASASNLRSLLEGSEIVASHRRSEHMVQDAYSLRCAPQVHGAFRDSLAHAEEVMTVEIGSVSDNPVVTEDGEIISGGNFHGQPVAVALDALAGASVGLASISERRLYRLLDPSTNNGLPPFLVQRSGLNSGFMIVQYTAASLVSESKALAHPAAADSIPSSAGQEDHVSMGMTSARHAREVLANAEMVVALEALAAAQAIELRTPMKPAKGTAAALAAIRAEVSFLGSDRDLKADVDEAIELVQSGALVEAVERAVGPLA